MPPLSSHPDIPSLPILSIPPLLLANAPAPWFLFSISTPSPLISSPVGVWHKLTISLKKRALGDRFPGGAKFFDTLVEACAAANTRNSDDSSSDGGEKDAVDTMEDEDGGWVVGEAPRTVVLFGGTHHDAGEGGVCLSRKGVRLVGAIGEEYYKS